MRISILCTDRTHPVFDPLVGWANDMNAHGHEVALVTDKSLLSGGDILFLVSCSQIIRAAERGLYRQSLVLHASDLPSGRGWSPHIWAVLNGANRITVSLLEAGDSVDSGRIWFKTTFELQGHELLPEINRKLFEVELALMTKAVFEFERVVPQEQIGDPGSYLRRRTPMDSRLDPTRSIVEQFDLLRTVDNSRYPAFFEYRAPLHT